MTYKLSLCGEWDWSILGGKPEKITVPSSYICVGTANFEKTVDINIQENKSFYLCFDGVSYTGKAWINGIFLGDMLPFVPYKFDITAYIKESNIIKAEITDFTAGYGPSGSHGGWEDYGGISRDVYIEITDEVSIQDYQLVAEYNDDLSMAECMLKVEVLSHKEQNAELLLELSLCGNKIKICKQVTLVNGLNTFELDFNIQNPILWSPQQPNLYDLTLSVISADVTDKIERKQGFKCFKIAGERLYLNNEELFLYGICRHEMWGDQGFTLTKEQIEQDLCMIKETGANFVRLVHYPHSKITIELCDKIGLLCTEEPGLWWSDLTDSNVTRCACEVMKKTVIRDRNNVSVMAWLLFNECVIEGAAEYLRSGRAICKALDRRPVAAASCLSPTQAKELFDQTEMDFYTAHPYSYEPYRLIENVNILKGKPLVLTEWGGHCFKNNANHIKWFKRTLAKYANNPENRTSLCGVSWWEWSDVFQFSRGIPGCEEGVLTESLVDMNRNKLQMYDVMKEFFSVISRETSMDHYKCEIIDTGLKKNVLPSYAVDLDDIKADESQKSAWVYALDNLPYYTKRSYGDAKGPVIKEKIDEIAGFKTNISGRPLILAGVTKSVEIPVDRNADEIVFFGNSSFYLGYPAVGKFGDTAAKYIINFENGTSETVDLRNGITIASASTISRASRINPVAANVEKFLKLTMDIDFECYQFNLLIHSFSQAQSIKSITFETMTDDSFPLLYGITIIN